MPTRSLPPAAPAGPRPPPGPSSAPFATPARLGAPPLSRRYEIRWLAADGTLRDASRLAPALPLFEQAFAGLARGTLLDTPAGPVAVEDLQPGAWLSGEDGPVQLTWCGGTTLYPGEPPRAGAPARLIRFSAEARAPAGGQAFGDVLLGPQALVLRRDPRLARAGRQGAAYLPAALLADGDSIFPVQLVTPMMLHHLVLSRPATLRAGGIGVASFHPGPGLAQTEARMLALFLAMFPQLGAAGLAGFGTPPYPQLDPAEAEALLSS